MVDIPGIVWPKILTGYDATLASLLIHLNNTERMNWNQVQHMQGQQLHLLCEHHQKNTPSFAQRLSAAGLNASQLNSVVNLQQLPIVNKSYIQQQGNKFFCSHVPDAHKPIGIAQTSGSTGQPVTIQRSVINNLMWEAMAFRDHQWHKRSFDLKYFSIRASIQETTYADNWGFPVSRLYRTAPSMGMNVSTDINILLDKMKEFQPGIVMLHAGVLQEMVIIWEQKGFDIPSLRHVKNVGDTVSPRLRERLRAVCGLEIEDNYSSSETGAIAIQCPHSGLLHTCPEALIVEILRQDGSPCQVGETGRVVVTDLHNFASPVIRYDLGDYAQVGPACTCGRTSPTLASIIGRERNTFLRPDGSRFWPRASMYAIPKVIPVYQWQMIQHNIDHVEYKLVTDQPPSQQELDEITLLIHQALGWQPQITISVQSQPIPRTPSGKFEECINLIPR